MSSKSLPLGLLALAAVGLPAAWMAWRESDQWSSNTMAAASSLAVPDLTQNEGRIARVRLVTATDQLELERSGEGWVLPSKGGYPAKHAEVVELLRGLAALELVEAKTARPELHAKVGLLDPQADPGQTDGSARRIEVLDGEGNALAELLLGDPSPGAPRPGLFVRKPGEDQTWLAKGEVTADANLTDWLDRDLLKLESDRIQTASVAFGGPLSETVSGYTASRAEATATSFELDELPEGKEVSSPWLVSSVARVPGNLRFDDVQAASGFEVPEDTEIADLTWETFDGVQLQAKAYRLLAADALSEGKTWIQLSASVLDRAGQDPAGSQLPTAGEAIENAEDAQAKPEPTREELEAEVQSWNLTFGPWVYGLDSATGNNLFRGLDELIRDIPEPEPEGAEAPAPSGLDIPGLNLPGLDPPSDG